MNGMICVRCVGYEIIEPECEICETLDDWHDLCEMCEMNVPPVRMA